MLFSSMTFIFVFLPVLAVIHFLSGKKFHNSILLLASLIFYAWGGPNYLILMLLTILINYFGARAIEKFESKRKLCLVTTIVLDLCFLFYFKYFNFLVDNINNFLHFNITVPQILLPLGISFYTFQAMSYITDVYRGEVKAQKNIYNLALYICLFPQLIAGPIIKYHDIEEQITSREINFEKVTIGVKRFIIGLSKKVLIANTLGAVADKIFSQAPDTFTQPIAWLGAFCYSFQIYFDFSGYSDMAIGLGLIFGFKFMENFNYPYISKSITEFWRRWHISLSSWFKQYVYIPLGGNKKGLKRTCLNLGIVFLLTGIWHGAAWNFVFWGIFNGFFIILEKILSFKEIEKKYEGKWQNIILHIYCILIFTVGWVIFRSDNLQYAFNYIKNMFGFVQIKPELILYNPFYYIDTIEIIAIITAILCCIPLFKNILEVKGEIKKSFINVWLLILFFYSTASIAANTYNPFIYFRF